MIRFLRVLVLVVVMVTAIAMGGCAVYYKVDNFIDPDQIRSSNKPDAVKVYVGKYRFSDGPGGPLTIGKTIFEGEMSLWIKKALLDEISNINFVEDKKNANIIIEPQNVSIDKGALGGKFKLSVVVNGQNIKIITQMKTRYFMDLAVQNNEDGCNATFATATLLAQTIKNSMTIAGNSISIGNLPVKIEAAFKIRRGKCPMDKSEIYDIEVTKAED